MNKVLPYSTGNSIQYLVINHNEKLHTHLYIYTQILVALVYREINITL